MKIYGFIIRTTCYLKDLHLGCDARPGYAEKRAEDGFIFFNENAVSKIFFYDIGYANLWRALWKKASSVFPAILLVAQHLFIYAFIAGAQR